MHSRLSGIPWPVCPASASLLVLPINCGSTRFNLRLAELLPWTTMLLAWAAVVANGAIGHASHFDHHCSLSMLHIYMSAA